MYCASCGTWNPDESDFCKSCGRPLQVDGRSRHGASSWLLALTLGGVLLALIAACVGGYLLRDRLGRAWQGSTPPPTRVAAAPTEMPTQVALPATATPSPQPTASPTAYPTPAPTRLATATPLPTALPRTFQLVYKQCIPHGFALGSVKGQVFDKRGRVMPGAQVRIRINDYDWKSDANPATANAEGWYEWTLDPGQKIQFVELIVDGRSVPFAPRDLEVVTMGGCFQRVDFVED